MSREEKRCPVWRTRRKKLRKKQEKKPRKKNHRSNSSNTHSGRRVKIARLPFSFIHTSLCSGKKDIRCTILM
jgi:hypothetical protein